MKYISTKQAPQAVGPYSQAVIANGILYISGQIPFHPETNTLVSSNVKEQTQQVMENLKAILTEAGSAFSKVIKCSIFLKDMNDFAVVNEVYGSYFDSKHLPARETVEVSRLPKDVLVEISLIAVA